MIEKQVTVTNKMGLHARAASRFVSTASTFTCRITVNFEGRVVDGKSIMSIITLAAGKGSTLHLTFEGDDESEACSALCQLIEQQFGEGT